MVPKASTTILQGGEAVGDVILYGASGHGKVVVDTLVQAGATVLGYLDDAQSSWGKKLQGVEILGGIDVLSRFDSKRVRCLVSVGDNVVRKRLVARIEQTGFRFWVARHPSASIAQATAIGAGTVIMAQVAVNPGAAIGRHVILNTACSVDHDCQVGDFAHLSPGVHLAGGVRVGSGVHLGVGVSVIPGVKIGANTVVGAGAAVVDDLPSGVTAVGVPARVIDASLEGNEA